MRVIAGTARSMPLVAPKGDGTRPTTDRIKETLGISGVDTAEYAWISRSKTRGAQIDLVIERDDRITDLCEMKCTDKPFSISKEYEMKLLNKKDVFQEESGTDQALKLVMVCPEGISGTAHTEHLADIITIEDLFA